MTGGGLPGIPRFGESSGGPWILDIIASSIRKFSILRVSGRPGRRAVIYTGRVMVTVSLPAWFPVLRRT
jgi:hypothetical protein